MTTALATIGAGLTIGDVLALELPHYSDEDRWYILWEYTGWPGFFMTSEAEPSYLHVLRRQLADFRNGKGE